MPNNRIMNEKKYIGGGGEFNGALMNINSNIEIFAKKIRDLKSKKEIAESTIKLKDDRIEELLLIIRNNEIELGNLTSNIETKENELIRMQQKYMEGEEQLKTQIKNKNDELQKTIMKLESKSY